VAEVVGEAPSGPAAEVRRRLGELRAMRARELRQELAALGLRVEGCVDRESLLELLDLQGKAALERQVVTLGPPQPADEQEQRQEEPPCSPEPGSVTVPIHMTSARSQYGVKAGGTRVVVMDLELGKGAAPCRFMLDTVSEHSIIKARVAKSLHGEDRGAPAWAETQTAVSSSQVKRVFLQRSWIGKLCVGDLTMAAVDGDLPVPTGVSGILGLDFLRLFDWDLDIKGGKATVTTAPPGGQGPVPFDLEGMHQVPMSTVKLPGMMRLLGCPLQACRPGQQAPVADGMAIIDLAATSTMCNKAILNGLRVRPEELREPASRRRATRKGFSSVPTIPSPIKELRLRLSIGNGPDGPATVEATAATGAIEVFGTIGLGDQWPTVIVGPDALCKSRLVLAPRLGSLWLPA